MEHVEVESTPTAKAAADTMPAPSPQQSPPSQRSRRLFYLVLLGAIAIGAGLAVRNSPWAQEKRLQKLSADELKLATMDSPNDALTANYFARALMNEERFDESAQAFDRAVKLDPKNAVARVGLATSLFRTGHLKEASEAYQEAIKLDPKLPDAYLGLAQVFYLAGSPKRAIDPMKKLTELQPNNATAWFTLGQMYGDGHMSDLALEAITRATQLDPNKPVYWRSLGRLSQRYSKLKDAEEQYKKCLKLDDNDAVAYLWLGQLYLEMGDTAEYRGKAEASLYRAVSRVPDMAEGYFALGQLYERRAIWDMAETNFRKAHEANRSDDQALYHLGLCLVKQGKAAEGNKLIAASHELGTVVRETKNLENRIIAEPQNRELRLSLARLYRKYGNDDDAKKRYMEYMRMGPLDPVVEKEITAYRAKLEGQAKAESLKKPAKG